MAFEDCTCPVIIRNLQGLITVSIGWHWSSTLAYYRSIPVPLSLSSSSVQSLRRSRSSNFSRRLLTRWIASLAPKAFVHFLFLLLFCRHTAEVLTVLASGARWCSCAVLISKHSRHCARLRHCCNIRVNDYGATSSPSAGLSVLSYTLGASALSHRWGVVLGKSTLECAIVGSSCIEAQASMIVVFFSFILSSVSPSGHICLLKIHTHRARGAIGSHSLYHHQHHHHSPFPFAVACMINCVLLLLLARQHLIFSQRNRIIARVPFCFWSVCQAQIERGTPLGAKCLSTSSTTALSLLLSIFYLQFHLLCRSIVIHNFILLYKYYYCC